MLRRGSWLLLAAAATAAPETRESERFRLEADATPEETDEILRLLEAAHTDLAHRFKAKPGKVTVLWKEGAPGEEPLPPGTVRVARQPTRYASRSLLLREYVRVFYELARAKGRPAATAWPREGLAEFLAGHEWDGKTLRLGVVPAVAAEDLPGQALAGTAAEGFDLEAAVGGATPAGRALAWALYGHMTTGDGGKPLSGFAKFEPKIAGGAKAAPLFWQCFGKPAEYAPAFAKWLASSQQPFLPIEGDWEGLSPRRVRGQAKGLGACRLKLPAAEMKATVLAPKERKGWRAGVVLSYAGERDYALFLADWVGYFHIFRLVEGKRQILEQGPGAPPSADGSYRIHLFRRKAQVYLMLEGGASYGPWELPGDGFGLAVEGCDLVFSDVSWK